MDSRENFVEELAGQAIVNALEGHQVKRVEVQEDPDTGHAVKLWVTFSDPAVLEIEAAAIGGEPALLARLHRRWSDKSPL